VHVEDEDIRPLGGGCRETGTPVLGRDDVEALAPEDCADQATAWFVVIYDENSSAHTHPLLAF